MTDGRGPDPLRCAEAAAEAALVLGLVVLPAAWRMLDGSLILTLAIYALHAVTFDCFRLTGQRARASLTYTQRKD